MADNVIGKIREYLPKDYESVRLSPYQNQVLKRLMVLENFANIRWGE